VHENNNPTMHSPLKNETYIKSENSFKENENNSDNSSQGKPIRDNQNISDNIASTVQEN
jgi:hypothetical protein